MFSTKDVHCTLNNPSIGILSNINVNEQMRQHTDGNNVLIFRFKNEHWEVMGMIMTERGPFSTWVGHSSGMTLLTGLKCWCLFYHETTHLYLCASTVLHLHFIYHLSLPKLKANYGLMDMRGYGAPYCYLISQCSLLKYSVFLCGLTVISFIFFNTCIMCMVDYIYWQMYIQYIKYCKLSIHVTFPTCFCEYLHPQRDYDTKEFKQTWS